MINRAKMMDEIKDVGDPIEKFAKGNQPMENQLSDPERILWFRRKRVAPVTIEIRVDGPIPMSILQDRFNIYLGDEKVEENTKLMQDKMKFFADQIRKLVEVWTSELR